MKKELFAMMSGLPGLVSLAASTNQPAAKPNILVIVADDLGWGHVGWQNSAIKTPNLDRLAAQGVKLNQHYVAPVCSPTRAGLMTGRCWSRFAINCASPPPQVFPEGTETVASALRSVGYRTALVGKWHIGSSPEFGPNKFGFDYFYGIRGGGITPLTHKWLGIGESALWRNDHLIEEPGHITDLYANEAIRWIGSGDNRPFFLYLSFTSPHVPLQEEARWMNLYRESTADLGHQLYWAAISHLDDAVGKVLAEVERIGQRENTLVVFFSDNGAPGQPNRMQVSPKAADLESYLDVTLPGDNLPLRGKKKDMYEGGIHTPAFACWPAGLRPRVCTAPIHVTDWMPTLCALAGYQAPRNLKWDGRDIWPLITGAASDAPSRVMYWKYQIHQDLTTAKWALREGDWKLIVTGGGSELFDVAADLSETQNLAADYPERVQRLQILLDTEKAKDNDALPAPIRTGAIESDYGTSSRIR